MYLGASRGITDGGCHGQTCSPLFNTMFSASISHRTVLRLDHRGWDLAGWVKYLRHEQEDLNSRTYLVRNGHSCL